MNLTKIYFQKNYPVADFQYEHYGVEIQLNEGDDINKAFDEAREITRQQWLRNAHQFEDSIHVIEPPVIAPTKEPEPELTLEDQINSCTEKKVLESYRLIVKGNKELQKIYDSKIKKLSK